jgi:hypothetical protein
MAYTKLIDGVRFDLTDAEIVEHEANVAKDVANIPAMLAEEARLKRNRLIAATDWMGNSDITMTSDMTTYRAALRDVPAQAGFPDNVTWPTLGES